jgi:hypothetical protein
MKSCDIRMGEVQIWVHWNAQNQQPVSFRKIRNRRVHTEAWWSNLYVLLAGFVIMEFARLSLWSTNAVMALEELKGNQAAQRVTEMKIVKFLAPYWLFTIRLLNPACTCCYIFTVASFCLRDVVWLFGQTDLSHLRDGVSCSGSTKSFEPKFMVVLET